VSLSSFVIIIIIFYVLKCILDTFADDPLLARPGLLPVAAHAPYVKATSCALLQDQVLVFPLLLLLLL